MTFISKLCLVPLVRKKERACFTFIIKLYTKQADTESHTDETKTYANLTNANDIVNYI